MRRVRRRLPRPGTRRRRSRPHDMFDENDFDFPDDDEIDDWMVFQVVKDGELGS